MKKEVETPKRDTTGYTTQIVSAFVQHNRIEQKELPTFIHEVNKALSLLGCGQPEAEPARPAVSVKKSVTDEYIVCLHDGKKLTMLKRYLRTHYNQSPEEYRRQFDLPHDYPMVAPAYARLRSAFAKKIGLGRVPVNRRKKP